MTGTMYLVFGMIVFLGIFFGMLWSNARRWRYLSGFYARSTDTLIEYRTLQSAVLLGLGGYNSLKGIVKIGVSRSGISLSILKPFSLFHEPLLIPFDEIRGWGTTWYLDGKSTELSLLKAPEVKIVMPTEQVEWIRRRSGGEMLYSAEDPPNGKSGRWSYFFVLLHATLGLATLSFLAWHFLTN